MAQKFESNGRMYDVEIFQHEDTDIVRFYEERNEQYGERLSNLVIGIPSYGFLLIQYIAGDAVLTGTLNAKYFCAEMVDDIVIFARIISPLAKHLFPYHIDFLQYLLLRNIMENIKEDN